MNYRKIITKLKYFWQSIQNFTRREKVIKLYKFRSLENLEYTDDIILNNQLYAADFSSMNDPMEGIFWHPQDIDQGILNQIKSTKKKIKICSMSGELAFGNPLMWAHYADSFKGVCLEFEVDESKVVVKEMEYDDKALQVRLGQNVTSVVPQEFYNAAIKLLSKKYSVWEYEKEYRIFSEDEYIDDGIKLKKIHLGSRISDGNRRIIHELVPNNVDIIDTDFDGSGMVIEKEV